MSTQPETIDPHDALQRLEDAVRDGDRTITATDLADARAAAELADLHADADRRHAERVAGEALEATRAQIRSEHLGPLAERLNGLRTDYRSTVNAIRHLGTNIDAYNTARNTAVQLSRQLGIGTETDATPIISKDDAIRRVVNEAQHGPAVAINALGPNRIAPHILLTSDFIIEGNQRLIAEDAAHRTRIEAEQEARRASANKEE